MPRPQIAIVKIGTNLLTKEDYSLAELFIEDIARQIITLRHHGIQVILVTSGAMAAGRSELTLKKESKNIPLKQALCAVGQGILINKYRSLFRPANIPVAQILLTNLDFTIKKNFLTTRNTLNLLLELGALPIINENDVVSFDEIKFGDNDNLSARLAAMIGADVLLLLTDVAGLYTANPGLNPAAEIIPEVKKVDAQVHKLAGAKLSRKSSGGMQSKIAAAQYATNAGIPVIIASGRLPDVIVKTILNKERHGTYFYPQITRLENQKKWILPKVLKDAAIIIDSGAARALKENGKSLLPAGIKAVRAKFQRGDIVKVLDPEGHILAYGMVNYSSVDLELIKGLHTDQLNQKLTMINEPEAIHRDNMIVLS